MLLLIEPFFGAYARCSFMFNNPFEIMVLALASMKAKNKKLLPLFFFSFSYFHEF